MKRIIDILIGIAILPFILPLIFIFSLILLIELKEFPFFSQERGLTLEKNRFTIYKLKTIKNSDNIKTIGKDYRDILLKPMLESYVPKFASWLRRTGLDELPQIFNILVGQMSFIGPRPLMLQDLHEIKNEYPTYYGLRNMLNAKPGLSGLWQVFCNREEGVENLITLDLIYEEMFSIKLDIKILLFTIAVVLTGSNADSIVSNNYFSMNRIFGTDQSTQFVLQKESKQQKGTAVQKQSDHYMVTLPGGWWFNTDSYSSRKEEIVKIIPLEKSKRRTA